MNTTRTARAIIITLSLLASFYVSFSDIMDVAIHYGAPAHRAVAWPLTIDGMILGCALTNVLRTGINKATRNWTRFGRYFGFAATVYCNALAAHSSDVTAVVFFSIPAISLIVLSEVVVHSAQGTPATRKARQAGKATAPAKLVAVR